MRSRRSRDVRRDFGRDAKFTKFQTGRTYEDGSFLSVERKRSTFVKKQELMRNDAIVMAAMEKWMRRVEGEVRCVRKCATVRGSTPCRRKRALFTRNEASSARHLARVTWSRLGAGNAPRAHDERALLSSHRPSVRPHFRGRPIAQNSAKNPPGDGDLFY